MDVFLISENHRSSRGARIALWAIIALRGVLLLTMIPDYFADNDLGYHISLGRQYGEHGIYFWDHLNYAPTGRPNLQGPLLHFSIGALGRLLGGSGDAYVLAFSLLAVLQWAMAVFTAVFFSRRFGGDWAALFAAALLTGCIWSAAPFFVGVPSGWIFILTPWAIHFFLRRSYLASALITTAVIYVHLGGAPVAPFGIFLAAVFTRDFKGLFRVGAICVVLASPYLYHFFTHLDWYNGGRGHVSGEFAILTYVIALPGLILLLRHPRRNLFLLIWLAAPLAWFFQDNLRFFLQSTIVASTIAGLFLAWSLQRLSSRTARSVFVGGIVLLATVFPLSIPSLPVEAAWAAGRGFPRELDWKEARTLAHLMDKAGLGDRIVASYYDSLSGAMAVYSPLRQEFGHWGEVRPPVNPARDISAGEKLYVLPLTPDDAVLAQYVAAGYVRNHGGSDRTTLATLAARAPVTVARHLAAEGIHEEAQWLAQHAVNNRMPPPKKLFDRDFIEQYRRQTTLQRCHAGRISLALLVYAYSLEPASPEFAQGVRSAVRAWGSIANFIGDETAIDYLSDARFELFRRNLTQWGDAILLVDRGETPMEEFGKLTDKLFTDFFGG